MLPDIKIAEPPIKERETYLARHALTIIQLKFISLWLGFMVIIFGIAMLTDIDWSKRYIEKLMCEATHRQVKLGHLTWTFGLGGLAIDTTKISITEKSGLPLLQAGPSEIGIAFWKLLSGELRLRHLYFKQPELWSIRYAPGNWNFDDLLKTTINIDYLECSEATVHIIDKTTPPAMAAFSPINLNSLKLKLVMPTARSNHPVFFSCRVPRNGFESNIKLSGFIRGGSENWQQHRTQLNLQLTQFDPSDLKQIATILNIDLSKVISQISAHKLAGLFDCNIDYKGVFDKDFQGTVAVKGNNIETTINDLGLIKAPHLVCKTDFQSASNLLCWKNTEITLADSGIEFTSEGSLKNWRSPDSSSFNGTAVGHCDNLSNLSKVFCQPAVSSAGTFNLISHLEGKALVDMTFSGNRAETTYKSKMRLSDLGVNSLKAILPEKYLPITLLLGLSGSSSQAVMRGDVSIDSQNSIALDQCTITDGATTYKASGIFNPKLKQAKCSFIIEALSLSKIADSLNQSSQIRAVVDKVLSLSNKSKFSFTGKADCQGQFSQNNNLLTYKTDIALNGNSLSISSPLLKLNDVKGHVICNNDNLLINDLTSTVDKGKLEISGFLPVVSKSGAPEGQLQLHLHGSHFDLANLGTLLTLFKIESPFFSHHQLSGLVKDISLDLDGAYRSPNLKFVALPEELYYQPPGLSRPLKAISGTVAFNHNNLDLKDVVFAINDGTVVSNLSVLNLLSDARLDKFRFKSSGVDIKDICYYFNSPLLPATLREPLLKLNHFCPMSFNSGKAYGNISGTFNKDKVELDGVVGLNNASLKLAGNKENVEHVNGAFTVAGNKLLLQDLSASVHGSNFKIEGKISNYQDANPVWAGELTANLEPSELAGFIPENCQQLKTSHIKLNASNKISVKLKGHGHENYSSINLYLNSDAQANFNLTGPVINFYQPTGEHLTFEGTFKLEPDSIKLSDLRLTVGSALLQAKGWFKGKFNEEYQTQANNLPEQEFDILVRLPEYVPTSTLLQLSYPSHENAVGSGFIKGFISAAGSPSHPRLASELHFNKVSVPALRISNLTGELVGDNTQESKKIKGRIKLDSLNLSKALLSNISGQIEALSLGNPTDEHKTIPTIVIQDCRGSFAGGKFNLDGSIDLSAKKLCLRTSLKEAAADEALDAIFGLNDEMTGTLNLDAVLGANFSNDHNSIQAFSNIDGSGTVKIVNGNVSRFSHLQTRITQGKLLHQGLFGFNVNNLFQSVVPVRTGNFRELETSLRFNHELLSIDSLEYDGDDLHLKAKGNANLALHTVELEIVGKVPRVSNSFIRGPVGEISKEFTVQRVIDSLTLHKLESLPSLPILGNVASDGPRQFTFRILAPYDQPKLVSQSIEKSFRWTEDRPLATALP